MVVMKSAKNNSIIEKLRKIIGIVSAFRTAQGTQSKAVEATDALLEENTTLVAENARLKADIKSLQSKIETQRQRATLSTTENEENAVVNEWRDRVQALEEQLRLAQRGSGTRRDQRFDTLYEHFTGHRAQQRVEELEENLECCQASLESYRQACRVLKRISSVRKPKGIRVTFTMARHARWFKTDGWKRFPCSVLAPQRYRTGKRDVWSNITLPAMRLTASNDDEQRNDTQQLLIKKLQHQLDELRAENKHLLVSANALSSERTTLKAAQQQVDKLDAAVKAKTALIAQLRNTITQHEQLLETQRGVLERYRARPQHTGPDGTAVIDAREEPFRGSPREEASKPLSQVQRSAEQSDEERRKPQTSKVTTDLEAKIAELMFSHKRELNAMIRNHEMTCAEIRGNYLRRLVQSQQQYSRAITTLKNEFAASKKNASRTLSREITSDESLDDKVLGAKKTQTEKSVMDDSFKNENDTFLICIPGSTASICVPLTAYTTGQDAVTLHVTFPSQQLLISKKTRSFTFIPGPQCPTSSVLCTSLQLPPTPTPLS